eukprot:TRINITY_DN40788_c0_g1_i1.p2 TRINITY_DN40788_c0_g1~~TRINITY_DN40788_c0_g1_i1.p2  ORF type:complete len:120 (+),score=26.96 TRINITY_DN40788_c0_g1_i1:152-511(+)
MLRSLVGSEMCIRDRFTYDAPPMSPTNTISMKSPTAMPTSLLSSGLLMNNTFACINQNTALINCKMVNTHTFLIRMHARDDLDMSCLLYTSDAADEEDSVDIGGCRNIKKKKKKREIRS